MATTAETSELAVDVEELIPEIERYLATVELFRSEGREPVWEREPMRAERRIQS